MNDSNSHLHQASGTSPKAADSPGEFRRKLGPRIATFIIMAIVWVVFSGKFDAFHLSLGAFSCALVAWLSSDLLFEKLDNGRVFLIWIRFALYIPWLIKEIFLANFWVLYLSCSPRMLDYLDPQVIKFKSTLKSRLAQVTFANSITLTPGTITVDVDFDGNFVVHALDWKSASALPGEMQRRVAKVFGE